MKFKKLLLYFLIITFVTNAQEVIKTNVEEKITNVKGQKIIRVYVDAIADLFHSGHVEFYKKARKLGDVLIVGLIGDKVATDYKRKPIMTLEERVKIVEACRYVDEVIPNSPLNPSKEWLEEHKIDFVVHGDDYTQEQIEENFGVAYEMGIYRTVPYTDGISTSDIIQRIVKRVLTGEFVQ